MFEFDEFDSSPENVTPIRLVDVATKIVEATKVCYFIACTRYIYIFSFLF